MLYKHNKTEKLDMALFQNPTAEYRGAPFWAWNCELEEAELLWQIEQLKAMGYGGFHMHTRSGMATKYLSDDFMRLIKSCTDKAKQENMLAWLYDEDRWPSGAAGGYVTKNPEYRQRRMVFTTQKRDGVLPKEEAVKCGETYLLGSYDVVLNEAGELAAYTAYDEGTNAKGTVWHAYCEVFSAFLKTPGWYNGGTYVDTMNPKAIRRFLEITHERYKAVVGDAFGSTIPAIFTDEPNATFKENLPTAQSKQDASVPWTPEFGSSFYKAYGYHIVEKIPELFWELPEGKVSRARYHFHDHVNACFTAAFADTCGRWCEENGIALTGHLYGEHTLRGQNRAHGDPMRFYRSFQIPGVDMLFNNTEYDTVKQAQSAAHQYGREGVMSELYGVTNWDFDFRGHKFQGDWQAALGVTVRVPHLSWVSMKGSAKRDYPASFNYQTPWYREYPVIENHFARLNTVLTRGKPWVNVAVIHPVESYWIHFGPEESTGALRDQLDEDFGNLIDWLLQGTVDFDFICESTLPELCGEIGTRLSVGKMSYSAVIVPPCLTLRKTTLDILKKFAAAGGKVIFAGQVPKLVDAGPSAAPQRLSEIATHVPFNRYCVLSAVKSERHIQIRDASGKELRQFVYQIRDDGQKYLFIANAQPPVDKRNNGSQRPTGAVIQINGEYIPTVLNTMTGQEEPVQFRTEDGHTTVYYDFYDNDSLLLRLVEGKGNAELPVPKQKLLLQTDIKEKVTFTRHEDNVCLLDLAEYALDDGPFEPLEEILRIDKKLREKFGWPLASGQDMQPWAMEKEATAHSVTLRFRFISQEALPDTFFCAEAAEALWLNEAPVPVRETGYFVDKSIKKYALPPLRVGENVITLKLPFAKQESLEACYLTGDFDVVLEGCEKTLEKAGKAIGFGDISNQGMPFYGGNITYRTVINVPQTCDLCIDVAKYKGAFTQVSMDGEVMGNIIFAPYLLRIGNVTPGEHIVEFTLFGNRHNTFGGLHNCGFNAYYGQHYWYSEDQSWSYEYNLKQTGILKSPVFYMYDRAPGDENTQ